MAHWLTRWARPGAGGWLLCAMLLAWELVSRFAIVPGYLLPAPVTVAQSLVQGISDGPLFQHARSTATAAVLGYVCGACVAFGVGVLVASSAWAERFLLVPLTAVQSIPKVALAPLVFVWLGFGIESTVTLVALACFYPVFANTVIGLRTADGELLELYRALGASRRRILLEVRIPHAAPLLFNALQLTAVFALIAAVVMEFVASTRGLGYLIQDTANTLDLGMNFAALLVLAMMGMGASAGIRALRRRTIFWDDRGAATQAGASP